MFGAMVETNNRPLVPAIPPHERRWSKSGKATPLGPCRPLPLACCVVEAIKAVIKEQKRWDTAFFLFKLAKIGSMLRREHEHRLRPGWEHKQLQRVLALKHKPLKCLQV